MSGAFVLTMVGLFIAGCLFIIAGLAGHLGKLAYEWWAGRQR